MPVPSCSGPPGGILWEEAKSSKRSESMRAHAGTASHAGHAHVLARDTLRLGFLLTLLILGVEAAGGFAAHSLALLSDAGHMLTDVGALGLAWFAAVQAERPANERRTFGYHRVGILTALVNGLTLVAISGGIVYEALQRFSHPEPVSPAITATSICAPPRCMSSATLPHRPASSSPRSSSRSPARPGSIHWSAC
jgi:Co/Zn/Cd efflux system component